MTNFLQSRRFRIQAQQVVWITIFWVLLMIFEVIIEYGIINFLKFDYNIDDILSGLVLNIFSAIIAGILGGSFLVFAWSKWLRMMSYGRSLLAIFISFTLIFIIVFSSVNGLSYFFNMYEELYPSGMSLLQLTPVFITYFKWLVICLITLIVLQINDKYGPGVFKSFLMGRYFHPKHEERIFMFLDLKSSTTIAEKLGEEKYFNFLKDCYRAITPAFLENKGEVYQYVGDEIVLSWKVKSGVEVKSCLDCFFEMKETLRTDSYFTEEYQIQPIFKAGIHGGKVMVGEMGVIKREIAFSGDVLNTTSRIQSKCNEFGVLVLISSYINDLLISDSKYRTESIGNIPLRGKENNVELYSIELNSNDE